MCFTYINSSNLYNNPDDAFTVSIYRKKTEAFRNYETRPWSHSFDLNPGSLDSLTTLLLPFQEFKNTCFGV